MWYTREEQALVIGAFYSMNGFQQCVGGLIAYGIAQVQHAALKNWQVLFTVRSSSSLLDSKPMIELWLAPRLLYRGLGFVRLLVAAG